MYMHRSLWAAEGPYAPDIQQVLIYSIKQKVNVPTLSANIEVDMALFGVLSANMTDVVSKAK